MIFLESDDVILINQIAVERYGGICGIRDKNLLDSALNNPQNLYFYQNADFYTLAASYAISIIKNHPFLDGNKRTGYGTLRSFLELNKININFPEDPSVEMMVKVACNEVSLLDLANWLRSLSPSKLPG